MGSNNEKLVSAAEMTVPHLMFAEALHPGVCIIMIQVLILHLKTPFLIIFFNSCLILNLLSERL